MQREIKYALWSLPWISVPTVALFFAEVRGYSKLYDRVDESPLGKILGFIKWVVEKKLDVWKSLAFKF